MIVYGDPQFDATLSTLLVQLQTLVAAIRRTPPPARSLDAFRALLIAAGQIEQGAFDSLLWDLPERRIHLLRRILHDVTGDAAIAFYNTWAAGRGETRQAPTEDALAHMGRALEIAARQPLDSIRVPFTVKIPDGYAFYALYPEQYCLAAERWLADHAAAEDRRAVVVGIRSIGTSLAASVAATLAAHGWAVHSVSVRPNRLPFQRFARLERRQLHRAAWGLVVDEGPGLSGSSMAAVGEAVERAGMPRAQISFLPGHGGEPGSEASDWVRAWWASTPRYVVPPSEVLFGGQPLTDAFAVAVPDLCGPADPVAQIEDIGWGGWRRVVYPDPAQWPAACAPFERPKYRITLQSGRRVLFKFAGLALAPGPLGTSAEAEAALLAERAAAGWGPAPLGTRHGFLALPWIEGTPLTRADADSALLAHIGRYIAEAAGPLLTPAEGADARFRLNHWLYWNSKEALGEEIAAQAKLLGESLTSAATVPRYGDGHLAPHEWLRTPDGDLIKVDSTGHAADHTTVGPQPVAWDLAGAWVEWGLDATSTAPLLAAYAAAGGTPIPPATLHVYRLAYAAFRLGQCQCCATRTAHDPADAARLWTATAFYRATLEQGLGDEV